MIGNDKISIMEKMWCIDNGIDFKILPALMKTTTFLYWHIHIVPRQRTYSKIFPTLVGNSNNPYIGIHPHVFQNNGTNSY